MSTLRPTGGLLRAPDRTDEWLLDFFFRQPPRSLLVDGVLATVLVATLWTHAPSGALVCWWVAVTLSQLLRASLVWEGRRHATGAVRYRRARMLVSAVTSGLAWGGLAWVYPLVESGPHQMLVLAAMLTMAGTYATLLTGVRGAVQSFGVCCLVPLAVVLALQPGAVHGWLAAWVLFYLLLVLIVLPRRTHRSLRRSLARAKAWEATLQRLETAEGVAGVGHFVWDPVSKDVQASTQLRRMLNLGDGPQCRNDLWRCLAPGEVRRLRAFVRDAMSRRLERFDYEVTLNRPGAVSEVHVVHRVQYDVRGQVVQGLTTVQDVSARKSDQRKLQALAFHDPLTGLVNRNRFQERLAASVDGTSGNGSVALLMLDLDHFKSVNDTLGHAVGDRLLVAAAERLQACVRPGDTVARLGGDEFALIAPQLSSGIAAAELAASVIQSLSRPFVLDQQEVFVSVSIGIALYPEDAQGADLLLRCADMALFEAKAEGRACFQFHTPAQAEQALARVALESDLRRALERREFELHFQPKVDMPTGRVVGAEALLRWHQRERGWVPPDDFIRIAEDCGLIVPIGEWVLREACRAAAAWNSGRDNAERLTIAVNLSPRQFWAPNLLTMVCDAMVETGCQPGWIELEITESLLLDARGQVGEVLAGLREMGFTLAIDDFGTGYSALGYLTRFPIGTLKIDRSFVCEVADDRQREAIVRAIVSMGHSLQLALVAEGVETVAQAEVLQALGCRLAQGWLYGRPVSRAAFEQQHLAQWLAERSLQRPPQEAHQCG